MSRYDQILEELRKAKEAKAKSKESKSKEVVNDEVEEETMTEIQNEGIDSNFIESDDDSATKDTSSNAIQDIYSVLDEDSLNNLASLGFSIVKTSEIKTLTELNMQLVQTAQAHQNLCFKHELLVSRLKELKKLVSKFYQMEAITLASKEALQAILRCFEGANQGLQGWPTIQVFTPDGWIKGSVDYNLHNAILLARTATTSENLKVVEKHVQGFTGQIKSLQQDISDLQSFIGFKVEKCNHCNRFKKVNSKCHHCGKSDSDGMDFLNDEDDEE